MVDGVLVESVDYLEGGVPLVHHPLKLLDKVHYLHFGQELHVLLDDLHVHVPCGLSDLLYGVYRSVHLADCLEEVGRAS